MRRHVVRGLVLCSVLIFIRVSPMQRHLNFRWSAELVTMDVIHRTGCLRDIGPVHSHVQASAICMQTEECIAVTVKGNATLALVTCNITQRETTLDGKQPAFSMLYKELCWNGGSQETSTFCKCSGGWVGRYCERRARDCTELFEHGYRAVATFIVINVYEYHQMCQFHSGRPAAVIMRHHGGSYLNISWAEFENGWHRGKQDLFVGLRTMYNILSLIANGAVLRLSMRSDTLLATWEYYNFTMANHSHSYSYDYTHSKKTSSQGGRMDALGDCLGISKGFPFSSFDQDNDGDDNVNCALERGAGWWFGNCSSGPVCSPFGLSPHGISPAQEKHVVLFPGLDLSAFRAVASSIRWYIHVNIVPYL